MNLFSRITATLEHSANCAVRRFENHDAIAETSLAHARQALCKANQRYHRLQNSGDDLRTRLADKQTEAEQWTTRACKSASTDESRALECLALRKRCHEQIHQLEQSLVKHETLEDQLCTQLKTMQSRLEQMSDQRNEMRSRESMAEAVQVMDRIDSTGADSVDAVFERWEMSIADTEIRREIHTDLTSTKPPLQRELEAEEREEDLRDELAELVARSEGDSDA